MELVITGYAGESGCRGMYQNEEIRKKLLDRYPQSFFVVWEKDENPAPNGDIPGVIDCENCGDGGVYGALWRLLKRQRQGAQFSQRAIPVRQQSIEVCETEDLDPYRVPAENTVIWLTKDASELKKRFPEAQTIGFTEKGPAIVRTDGEHPAYLRKS